MSKLTPPIAALFDFDGVLVNSENTHHAAWKVAYKDLFKQEIPPFPSATHAGKSPRIIAEYFAEYAEHKEKSEELYQLKTHYLHTEIEAPELLPGVREILQYLNENNIPYGIASNATRGFVENTVKAHDLGIDVCFGYEDYTKPKPDPQPYLLLAEKLGLSRNDFDKAWIFEDSLTGTNAAKLSGITPIGLTTQYSQEELVNAGSKLVFPTLLEVYKYLINEFS